MLERGAAYDPRVFATLLGALPRPDDVVDDDAAVEVAVRAQEQAGLEPITDGRLRRRFDVVPAPKYAVRDWRQAGAPRAVLARR
jgi:hypothetical protein